MQPSRARITGAYSFEAAHQLPWHPGRCQRLHGHHYRFEVTLEGAIDGNGVVMDFEALDSLVRSEIIGRYDHELLNDSFPNPTAENIAAAIWQAVADRLPRPSPGETPLQVVRVRLWETPDASVELVAG